MNRRLKPALLAAFVGALIGALFSGGRLHNLRHLHVFTLDQVLLSHRFFWNAAVVGWVVFSLYWEVAARNAAAAKSSESSASRGVHVVLTNAALLLVMAPIHGLGRFLPATPLIMTAGLVIEAAGLFMAIWSRRHLGENWSGKITIKVDHQLIRSGPYRLIRHPIYTGLLAMYLGAALVTGERLALIGLVMGIFAYWRKIRLEEVNMDIAFGADYGAYRRESWALIPGLF